MSRKIVIFNQMKKIKRILLWLFLLILVFLTGTLIYIKLALPNVGPAPDLKVEMTAERIARGEYLANHVAVCIDCHSKRDWTRFSGPPTQGTFGMGGDRTPETWHSRDLARRDGGGDSSGITGPAMAGTIRRIKAETGLAVTLSLGERDDADLRAWREAGADRYLLRFETTDPALYRAIHPSLPGTVSDRIRQLLRMRDLGYEIGTGVMVGIPGPTWDTLADDIWTFRDYDMDMIGIGPYIASPGTPLAGELGEGLARQAGSRQVPADETTTLKAVALTRLLCPETNIPSTTALATIDPGAGRANGLLRGANVVMPNLTQPRYRVLYQIYPGKAGLHETADITREKLEAQIHGLGRTIGRGPGGRGKANMEAC